jgi:hypothetical protein
MRINNHDQGLKAADALAEAIGGKDKLLDELLRALSVAELENNLNHIADAHGIDLLDLARAERT